MTKEQEESIEYLKKHIKYFEEQIKFIEATDCDYYDEELELYQNRIKQFNTVLSMLEEKDKGINSLMQSRKKWKNRYYKIKNKNKDLQKSVEQIYDDYQDIGKMYFDLDEKRQKLIEKLKNKIRYYEENDEILATSNDNYSDGTVIKKIIDEFKEILSILKGE